MAANHTVADDIVYDLVSIQYHALKADAAYARYLDDAHAAEHTEITSFVEDCRRQDQERARRCHELLGALTADSGIGR